MEWIFKIYTSWLKHRTTRKPHRILWVANHWPQDFNDLVPKSVYVWLTRMLDHKDKPNINQFEDQTIKVRIG